MQKSSNLSVRIDPELKQESEEILSTLGITMSNAITLFLKQVVLQKGIPFSISLPKKPKDIEDMSEGELKSEIDKALKDEETGKIHSSDEVKQYFKDKYKI